MSNRAAFSGGPALIPFRTGDRNVKANIPSDLSYRNEYLHFVSLGCFFGITLLFFQDWNVPAH